MKNKQNKFKIKITAIIAGIVLFGLLLPKFSYAIALTPAGIAKAIIRWLTHIILSFFGLMVKLAAAFFDGMIDIGFEEHQQIAETGWKLTRDFSNMFFILFIVIVAFATILRIEEYGVRKLLPKVIIIALLINFSLVISYVIIDFSNIAAKFFIQDAKDAGNGSISAPLVDSLNLTKTLVPRACDDYKVEKGECYNICAAVGPPDPNCIRNCEEQKENAYEECIEGMAQAEKTLGKDATFTNMIISMVFGSVILLIGAFVLFAGGVLLLVRVIFLWFLVMLVPLAFLGYIMPGLRFIWQKWWNSFLKWCFFAPAYAFFIWLAVKLAAENRIAQISAVLESDKLAGSPTLVDRFATSIENLMGFLFLGGLLIGGLIAAQQLGIYGASTAISLGQKAYRGAAKWTGARVRERAAKPMEGLAKGMAAVVGRAPFLKYIPGLKQLAQAPALVLKAQRADIGKAKKDLEGHSVSTLKGLYPVLNKTQQIAAAQLLAERGKLAKGGQLTDEDIEKNLKVANRYGEDLAMNLLSNRPDLAPAVGKTKEEVVQKIGPGKADKIQTESFRDPETMGLMLRYFRGKHLEKIAETSVENSELIQDAIHGLGPNIGARQRALGAINPRLTIYINNTTTSGLGTYTFA